MMHSPENRHPTEGMEGLADRLAPLRRTHGRIIVGLAGAPGAGKTTLASRLAELLGRDTVATLPMDGFHLAHAELERLGLADRKGALDTFDAYGFVALLRRIVQAEDEVVYAPDFDRRVEDPIAGSIPVSISHSVVIVEGNYLLVDDTPWDQVRALLTTSWFLELDDLTRQQRLAARHQRYGKTPRAAESRALGNDQHNADLVAQTAHRADLIITMGTGSHHAPSLSTVDSLQNPEP